MSVRVGFSTVAAADLPGDDGASQLALGDVVGRGNGFVLEKLQQRALVAEDVLRQPQVVFVREVLRDEPTERLAQFADRSSVGGGREAVPRAAEFECVLK